jgi:hypothetical protein
MDNHFEKLVNNLAGGKDKQLTEYAKANIIRTFCPHMFFQDMEKIQCRTAKGTIKAGFSCEKCWGCKIVDKPLKKKERNKNGKKKNRTNQDTPISSSRVGNPSGKTTNNRKSNVRKVTKRNSNSGKA